MARGTAKVNAYPCCECCLTDPLHPDHHEVSCPTCNNPSADRLRAERDRLAEAVRAYGRTIDRWGLLIIAATRSEDITTPGGDGDWEVIESRLAEVPALLAAAWDEGHADGLHDAHEYREHRKMRNPYRPETAPRDAIGAPVTPAAPDAINPPPNPPAAVTEPHSTERTTP